MTHRTERWLEIIEEGLQLKLEIQNIKDKFLNLVHDLAEHEEQESHRVLRLSVSPNCNADTVNKLEPKMSAARTRVRALYEARKARIRARRSSASGKCQKQLDTSIPPSKVQRFEADDDKENICKPPTDCRNPNKTSGRITSTPLGNTTQARLPAMTWSIRKFLTPDKEQHEQSSVNIRCLPKNLLTPKSNSLFRRSTSKDKPTVRNHDHISADELGDSVSDCSVKQQRSSKLASRSCSRRAQHTSDARHDVEKTNSGARQRLESSRKCWRDRVRDIVAEDSPVTGTSSTATVHGSSECNLQPSNPYLSAEECLKTPSSDKEINDISQISLISRYDFHEQVSSANISGAFHSTFNYPLHSTLNYPLHSTFSMTSNSIPKDVPPVRDCADSATTVSEPSADGSERRRCQRHQEPLFSLPRQTLDDNCLDYQAFVSRMSSKSSILRKEFSSRSFRTPTKKPQAQLCKEHGIHPTFDGSCIFQNGDTPTLNSSDEELDPDENGNSAKVSSNVRETDCDSSYLSECLDEHQTSIDVDEYAAVYNTRSNSTKVLKRQIGQVELKDVKEPVGLSESDFYWDSAERSASVEANCASLPRGSELSEDDKSESTLHASSIRRSYDVDEAVVGDETLIGTEQRSSSLYVNEESPESNTAMPVPVNSPNVTDSGGSSSRQNTDNYEYMEMQPQQQQQQRLPTSSDRISLPGSHTTHSSKSCHSRKTRSSQSHHSNRSSRSHRQKHRQSRVDQQDQRHYSSTPSQLHGISGKQNTKLSRYTRKQLSSRNTNTNRHYGYDWDSGCSSHSARSESKQFTISDNTGRRRTIIPERTPENLAETRKHLLAKKLKVFSNSFYKAPSADHLQIQTLGHF